MQTHTNVIMSAIEFGVNFWSTLWVYTTRMPNYDDSNGVIDVQSQSSSSGRVIIILKTIVKSKKMSPRCQWSPP